MGAHQSTVNDEHAAIGAQAVCKFEPAKYFAITQNHIPKTRTLTHTNTINQVHTSFINKHFIEIGRCAIG